MRRRPVFLAAVALPISIGAAAAALAPGCGSDEQLDDICGFLRDPDNCYREFFDEVRTRCGDTFTAVTAEEIENSGPKGTFLAADALDLCVLSDPDTGAVRGQVVIDSSPTLDQFPLTKISFQRLDARSETCGAMSATSQYNFGVSINACNQDATDVIPVCKDAFDGSGSVSGEGRDPDAVTGGAFSVAAEEGRDVYLTTCPSGDSFRFNRFEQVKCDGYEQLMPSAELDSFPSRLIPPWEDDTKTYEGWIRFRVHYPPYEGDLENAEPVTVQYFNCTIPPQDPCQDGIKDFYETDVDCGGPTLALPTPSQPGAPAAVRFCDRCGDGQICQSNEDCESGICSANPTTGFMECEGDNGGSGGGGGAGGTGGAGGGTGGTGGA